MNQDILDSLDFFSNLTQKTLSAFHLTGLKNDLYEEIKLLEELLNKSKKRKLVKVKIKGPDIYTRYFSDGFIDEVPFEDLQKESFKNLSTDLLKIESILNRDFSPILSLRLGNEIIECEFKPIDKPIEKLFFI